MRDDVCRAVPPVDQNRFWIARGRLPMGPSAVTPGKPDTPYQRWKRRCLQEWTVRRVRRHLGGRFARAVDLGCGYGDWTVLFAVMADEIVACDVSPGFVAEAERRLRAAGHPAASVVCADVRSFDAFEETDFIYLGAVLMYLDDADCLAVLRRVRERIRGGGLLVSRDWCAINAGRPSLQTGDWFSVHRRPRRYEEFVRAAGFRVVERAASPAIYGEHMAHVLSGRRERLTRVLRGPARLCWRAATLGWTRASVSFVMRPA
jgi:SAM-dependent methyltransferase